MANSEGKRGRQPKQLAQRVTRFSVERFDYAKSILSDLMNGKLVPPVLPNGYIVAEDGNVIVSIPKPDGKASAKEWREYAIRKDTLLDNLPTVATAFHSQGANVSRLARALREGMADTVAAHNAAQESAE